MRLARIYAMLLIKRYPNRKLYDTEAKQYITLEDIASFIRQGREIQVVDHSSGEDITALVLTQIIFEQEKKQAGFVPRSVLTGLVQTGGQTLGRMRRALAVPLDLLRQIDEEIERRIEFLISRGDLGEEEARRLREKLLLRDFLTSGVDKVDEQQIEQILIEQGVVTREDLQNLTEQIEILSKKLESIQ
jgi:polyhydroxyalkanoate synthesis repressor PhaR